MALTKTGLQTLVSTNLADNSNIPAELHREVENELINSIYGSVHTQSAVGGNIPYSIRIEKRGDLCFISGEVENETPQSMQVGTNIFNITNVSFAPASTQYIPITAKEGGSSSVIKITSTGVVTLNALLGQFTPMVFSTHYKITE
jgi:hypothetical protein